MKKTITFLLVALFLFAVVAPVIALAAEDAAHKAVGGTMKTVGEAAKGTTETAVSPLVAFWRSIRGKGSPDKVVTEPIKKGGETVYEASKGTGKTITGQDQ